MEEGSQKISGKILYSVSVHAKHVGTSTESALCCKSLKLIIFKITKTRTKVY